MMNLEGYDGMPNAWNKRSFIKGKDPKEDDEKKAPYSVDVELLSSRQPHMRCLKQTADTHTTTRTDF